MVYLFLMLKFILLKVPVKIFLSAMTNFIICLFTYNKYGRFGINAYFDVK